MKIWITIICNLIWVSLCFFRYIRFRFALYFPGWVQQRVLMSTLHKNRHTVFGKKHRFEQIKNATDFRKQVPIRTYEGFAPYIERMASGEKRVLTHEDVIMFELSSGSASASKMIPYTQSLKTEFSLGISPWIFDMYWNRKPLLFGTAYWSITPPAEKEKKVTSGGIPIGFEEDSQYFGRIEKWLVDKMMAVPSEVKHMESIVNFRYVTLFYLLKNKDLAFVSVWNPTFFMILLDDLADQWDVLIQDIERGTLTLPDPAAEKGVEKLTRLLKPDSKRAEALRKLSPHQYSEIWKRLRLISCWTDGHSASYAEQLKKRMSGIPIQGKGLIATEGFVSFPLERRGESVLSILTHFYEFVDIEENPDQTWLGHELEIGKRYSVIITTGGGLYRYRLQDLVEVTGFTGKTPLLRFIGKEDKLSDHFGEKLNEHHVSEVLSNVLKRQKLPPLFAMLAPDLGGETKQYTLFIEINKPFDAKRMLAELDEGLRGNFHYDYCRKLGQLSAPKCFFIKKRAMETYLWQCQRWGQKLGNIKPCVLHSNSGWNDVFDGDYLE